MAEEQVWLVTYGSYSDYRVLCACKSKTDAETLAERCRALERDVEVESRPLVEPSVELLSRLSMSVDVLDTGCAEGEYEHLDACWSFEVGSDQKSHVSARWIRCLYDREARQANMAPIGGRLTVNGFDHERVRKVYSDLRAALMTDDALRARRQW